MGPPAGLEVTSHEEPPRWSLVEFAPRITANRAYRPWGFSFPHKDCIDSRYGSIVFLFLVSSASNTVALWDEGFSLTVFGSLSTSSSLGIRDLYSFSEVSLRVGGFS